ncbi:MAG: precorrin-3B C(17)-methyltransferase [Thermodesulfobacteria bacterium]|nr:precorrin-3B C(17)-methyltransferase [Thermodesulfobacteriota bacterium]
MPKQNNKLFIIGIGPGDLSLLTLAAQKALEEAEIILGYKTYLNQIEPYLQGKEVRTSQMTQEVERAKEALRLASRGRKVALVSGGDPSIYGMSAPVFEVLAANRDDFSSVEIEIIPGVTAACAAAARLGAPLSSDCAFISLSDRLTPWKAIKKRVALAAEGDFVLVFYNPKSKRRQDQLYEALEIVKRHRSPETPLALVRAAFRQDESILLTTLTEAEKVASLADMASLVIVGNSQSQHAGDFFLTPRGYGQKYALNHENP